MTTRLLSLVVALMAVSGCRAERQSVGTHIAETAPWSRQAALAVLHRAVESEDDSLREEAWIHWLDSQDPSAEPLVARAVMDPSPLVQRALARHHAPRVGDGLVSRSAADPVALAWLVLQGFDVPVPPGDLWATLFPALGGEADAQRVLLSQLRAGQDVLDPGVVEVIASAGIEGMDEALIEGAAQAEAMLADEIRLAALGLGSARAAKELLALDAPAELSAWAIEVAVRHPSAEATERLKRFARSSEHSLSLYARLGLMALGHGPQSDGIVGLKDSDRDTRAWAATCIRYSRMDRAVLRDEIALLQGSTRDESSRVRVESVKTLVELVGVESVPLKPPSMSQEPGHAETILAAGWLSKFGAVE